MNNTAAFKNEGKPVIIVKQFAYINTYASCFTNDTVNVATVIFFQFHKNYLHSIQYNNKEFTRQIRLP